MQNKNNEMLVQLSASDLFQLIKQAVKEEMDCITDVIKLNPTESENESDLLTRVETAKLLGVSTTTLFLWNRDKTLQHTKLKRRVYYSKKEVYNKLNLKATA
ncbi:helix-turn-helix domain-containing protein [Flavobacterium sp.]|uniref:helix-turn-helix domain-containing protein n=1 Tax=Flavobacterium sp. TaxID=239 RepID=UPI0040478A0C